MQERQPDEVPEASGDGEITRLLEQARQGHAAAAEDLFVRLQAEMRRTAARLMQQQPADHTLQPTAIVNEAVLRLLKSDALQDATNSRYLFGAANQAMSRALADHARLRRASKRADSHRQTPLDQVLDSLTETSNVDFADLREALDLLKQTWPRQAEITELRFFAGLTTEQIAAVLEIAPATVKRDWALAKARLYRTLTDDD